MNKNKKIKTTIKKVSTLKGTSKKKKDRSWIRPPNSITNQNDLSFPSKISYWVDEAGEVQLYTKEQLAKCNILMNINLLLSKSLKLFENLQKIDKDTPVGTLVQQDYAQFKTSEDSVYTHFIQLMATTPDITFGEFLNFISEGDDTKAFSKIGEKKLKKVIKDKSPEVISFFTSDKLKKIK